MRRLQLIGAVVGSFLVGYGLGSYFCKPQPIPNYHTPVSPAKEETSVPVDEKVIEDRVNPVLGREDVSHKTPYHSYADMERETDEIMPLDPNDPDNDSSENFDMYMSDIEVVDTEEELFRLHSSYADLHLTAYLGQGIVVDHQQMILPKERVKDLVGDWDEWIQTGDTQTTVYLYNHRLHFRIILEGVRDSYEDYRENIRNGR